MFRAVLAEKILGAMGLEIRENQRDLGGPPANVFAHALFALRKCPILEQRLATYVQKCCKNERAKMKDCKQNDRNRVQDDIIMENTNARSPLIFRNFLYVVVYMQSQKTQRKLEQHFAQV